MEFRGYYKSGCGGPPTSSPKCKLDEANFKRKIMSECDKIAQKTESDFEIRKTVTVRVAAMRVEQIVNKFFQSETPVDTSAIRNLVDVLTQQVCIILPWCEDTLP